MEQLKTLITTSSNIILGENLNYSILISTILIITAIISLVAFFKFIFLFKEHYYSLVFLKKFKDSNDFEETLDSAEVLKNYSILANCFFKGFKTFYSIYKINPHYQSGSTLELSKRRMETLINKKTSEVKNYSFFIYIALMLPGISLSSIIYNYADYIEINKSFININPMILVDSLRLFFLSIVSSLIIISLFLSLDKYLEYRYLSFQSFIDEYVYIMHRNFYTKESDIERTILNDL